MLTNKIASAFNKVRTKFEITDTAEFLVPSETADEFEVIATAVDSFHFEYEDFRQRFRLEVAVNEEPFNTDVLLATHIRLGTDIYTISNADTVAPKGIDFTWKFYCQRFFKRGQIGNIL
jgi:hypothetical protein